MITRTIESKTLTRHTSCKCKCQFGGKKCNSNQIWNNYKCRCECKNPRKILCEEGHIWVKEGNDELKKVDIKNRTLLFR